VFSKKRSSLGVMNMYCAVSQLQRVAALVYWIVNGRKNKGMPKSIEKVEKNYFNKQRISLIAENSGRKL